MSSRETTTTPDKFFWSYAKGLENSRGRDPVKHTHQFLALRESFFLKPRGYGRHRFQKASRREGKAVYLFLTISCYLQVTT